MRKTLVATGSLLLVATTAGPAAAVDFGVSGGDTVMSTAELATWAEPVLSQTWNREFADPVQMSAMTVHQMMLPRRNADDAYVVFSRIGHAEDRYRDAKSAEFTASFTRTVTENQTITRNEKKCETVTKGVRATKWVKGKKKIRKAKANGWKRVKGTAKDPQLGVKLFRVKPKKVEECTTVKVTETKPVKVTKGTVFTATLANGRVVSQQMTVDGKKADCGARWNIGIQSTAPDFRFTNPYFPVSCIRPDTYDVAFKVRLGTRSVDHKFAERLNVTADGIHSATGVHDMAITSNVRAGQTPPPAVWSGTVTDSIRYDKADRMVVVTQKYRGRVPDLSKTFDLNWMFFDSRALVSDSVVVNHVGITVHRENNQWTVTPREHWIANTDGYGELTKWACDPASVVDFSFVGDTATLKIPAECFGTFSSVRLQTATGFRNSANPIEVSPVSQPVRNPLTRVVRRDHGRLGRP